MLNRGMRLAYSKLKGSRTLILGLGTKSKMKSAALNALEKEEERRGKGTSRGREKELKGGSQIVQERGRAGKERGGRGGLFQRRSMQRVRATGVEQLVLKGTADFHSNCLRKPKK